MSEADDKTHEERILDLESYLDGIVHKIDRMSDAIKGLQHQILNIERAIKQGYRRLP